MEDQRQAIMAKQLSFDDRLKAMMEQTDRDMERLKSLDERLSRLALARSGGRVAGQARNLKVAVGEQGAKLQAGARMGQQKMRELKPGAKKAVTKSKTFVEGLADWHESYQKQHLNFMKKVHGALSVAFFVSLFSFMVFSSHVRHWLFGHEGKSDGILPFVWLGSWSGCVITIMFTIQGTCGSTIVLAYQNIVGTLVAMLNIWFLMLFFPEGAKGPEMHKPYSNWVCWVDALGVTFLYLISSAQTNTLKIGLSTHLGLIMNFMNPSIGAPHGTKEWYYLDSSLWTSLFTVMLGSLIAVGVTYFPHPHTNLSKLDNEVQHLSEQFGYTWALAIKYMAGEQKSTAGQQVGTKVKSVEAVVPTLSGELSASWWECFDLYHYGTKRAFYDKFVQYVQHLNHVMNAVASSCADEDFGGDHIRFFNMGLGQSMMRTRGAIQKLLLLSCQNCADGEISSVEQQSIREASETVKGCLQQLSDDYKYVTPRLDSSSVSEDLANESVFLFLLVIWGRRTVRFCEETFLQEQGVVAEGVDVVGYIKETANPHFENHDHVMFAIRNTVSISIMFVIGYHLNAGVFPGYDATAACTLALLADLKRGAAFKSSLSRLLGVSLGKTLPMVLLMIVNYFDCGSPVRTPVHLITVFFFVFAFVYVMYTSEMWAGAAGGIAAFGTGFLVESCKEASNNNKAATDALFSTNYSSMGQLVCAVVVQMAVDACFRLKAARALALEDVDEITKQLEVTTTSLFQGKSKQLDEDLGKLTGFLAKADGMAGETDPMMQVAPGVKSAFRKALYMKILNKWRLLLSDYYLLQWTLSTPELDDSGHLLKILKGCDAWKDVSKNFRSTLKDASDLTSMVLKHDTDGNIEGVPDHVKDLRHSHGLRKLDGMNDLLQQLNQKAKEGVLKPHDELRFDDRVRLSVFLQALRNATTKLGEILLLCLSEDIFGEDEGYE